VVLGQWLVLGSPILGVNGWKKPLLIPLFRFWGLSSTCEWQSLSKLRVCLKGRRLVSLTYLGGSDATCKQSLCLYVQLSLGFQGFRVFWYEVMSILITLFHSSLGYHAFLAYIRLWNRDNELKNERREHFEVLEWNRMPLVWKEESVILTGSPSLLYSNENLW